VPSPITAPSSIRAVGLIAFLVRVFNKIAVEVFEFCGGYRDIPGAVQ
jgi:hypothetical protein